MFWLCIFQYGLEIVNWNKYFLPSMCNEVFGYYLIPTIMKYNNRRRHFSNKCGFVKENISNTTRNNKFFAVQIK